MINKNKKIFICATEQSGDNIGYNIMHELLKIDNSIIFDGVGGGKMSPFLKNQYYSLKNFNSLGIIEVIFSIRRYLKMISTLISKIISNDYDLVIIDSYSTRSINIKWQVSPSSSYVGMYGYFNGPEVNRVLFSFHQMNNLLGFNHTESEINKMAKSSMSISTFDKGIVESLKTP